MSVGGRESMKDIIIATIAIVGPIISGLMAYMSAVRKSKNDLEAVKEVNRNELKKIKEQHETELDRMQKELDLQKEKGIHDAGTNLASKFLEQYLDGQGKNIMDQLIKEAINKK